MADLQVSMLTLDEFKKAAAEKQLIPGWARGATLTQLRNVLRGRHPVEGAALLAPNPGGVATCGNCRHLVRKELRSGRVFFKCALARDTAGPATDTRKRWPACVRWLEEPEIAPERWAELAATAGGEP